MELTVHHACIDKRTPPPAATPAHDGDAATTALRQAIAALDAARHGGQPLALCEALGEAARCLGGSHAYASAESCLTQALRSAARLPAAADLRAELLCALAELASTQAAVLERQRRAAPRSRQARLRSRRDRLREKARQWAAQAGAAALKVTDPHWERRLLLRTADVLLRAGDEDDALRLHERVQFQIELSEARRHNLPLPDAWQMPAPAGLM